MTLMTREQFSSARACLRASALMFPVVTSEQSALIAVMEVYASGGDRILFNDLQQELLLLPPVLSRVVSWLTKRGYAERLPHLHNRRKVWVATTKAGNDWMHERLKEFVALRAQYLDGGA